jgi:acyl-CoA synthetase (AMP-forming)/AMP-acid ligase II
MNNQNDFVNVAAYLKKMAEIQPYKKSVIYPESRDINRRVAYTHLTFQQLDQESDRLAVALEKIGITRGVRTVLMVKPSINFFAIIFALFKLGAIPVVVDPGMGLRKMVSCLKKTKPQAFIGIPVAHILRVISSGSFKTVKTCVTVGRKIFWGGHTLKKLKQTPFKHFKMAKTLRHDTAAILFTTGSTGPAKGVIYSYGNFDAQLHHIQSHLKMNPEESDLSTFPLFALFWPALGVTSVIPDMDATKPAKANPKKLIEAINDHGITNMFASPALLKRLGEYGASKGIKLPSLKRVISAGAPVSPQIIELFHSMLETDAKIHTPYGATEAVPIISITSDEILSETKMLSEQGYGICIGRPINDIDIRIIKISDEPIEKWHSNLLIDDIEIGEIIVCADHVSSQYYDNPSANALSKINDKGRIWHRMGDLGWKDTQGRIWFCGRKSHRVITDVKTMFSIPSESIFNNHPRVLRSALVGIGSAPNQKPVICIELEKGVRFSRKKEIKEELLELAGSTHLTSNIDTVLFHKSFPVDIRHNSKIFREKLKVWAEKKMKA